MPGKRGVAAVGIAVALCVAVATVIAIQRRPDDERRSEARDDPVTRACELDHDILTRIWRGHDPTASEDVTIVPREPNYLGTFELLSHSGPWDYLQRIPLVLYGPEHIAAAGAIDEPANIVDIYPTVGELLDVDLPARDGEVLDEALASPSSPPRLVVVVVWDGAGRATLERWPDRWPTLARLEREGTSYRDATVGTSPSVTSAVHASLGTGAWPREHRVTGNDLRQPDGRLEEAFAGGSADAMTLTTFADEVDKTYDNRSMVGMLAWTPWHIGMLGHGRGTPGGDADEMGLLEYRDGVSFFGEGDDFSTPAGLLGEVSIEDHVTRLDRSDGRLDGEWRGHDISVNGEITWLTYWNPAWAAYQGDLVRRMIDRGAYGRDEVTDLLFVNFKMTDLAAHRWGIDSPESAAALEAQDRALGEIVEHLDAEVGDYVLALTADHGQSASPATSGAWPIVQDRMLDDIDAHFGVEDPSDLVEASPAFGLYLDEEVMNEVEATPGEVAAFLNGYTIQDNWGDEELPDGYGTRGEERVFSAAFPKRQMRAVMRCAFGKNAPPADPEA